MDGKGTIVISPKYQHADYFQEGRALVWREPRRDAYTGAYIDEKDRVVFQLPGDCTIAYRFSEGLAWFRSDDSQEYGCYDRNGKLVIRPKYDDVGNFSEGLARVNRGAKLGRQGGGKWGYVDTSGREVISLHFDRADDFCTGHAEVWIGERSFFIDANGKEIPASKIARQPHAKEDLPPEVVRIEDGRTQSVNERRRYRGELAAVHLGGKLVPVMDSPFYWTGGAWYYVNRKGEIVRRKCEDPEN